MTGSKDEGRGVDERAKALVAITLLEHAMGLLTAASNEGPKKTAGAIGCDVASINRKIAMMQSRLFRIVDAKERDPT